MKYVFIDTNIYLSFYHFNDDDLGKLEALVDFNSAGQIEIIKNRQILDEFSRNRETKIFDALKQFSAPTLGSVPRLFEQYKSKSDELRKLIAQANDVYAELIQDIKKNIKEHDLTADILIKKLFVGDSILLEEDILSKARIRMDIGNPPGKRGSLGDAYHWEYLLKYVPQNSDLIIVTDDIDWKSSLNPLLLNDHLIQEWQTSKNSNITLYVSIKDYFKNEHPDIKLSGEYKKDLWIKNLADSGSFDRSRLVLMRLLSMGNFSDEQLAAIVLAAISNDQIYNAHKYSPDTVVGRLWDILAGKRPPVGEREWKDFWDKFQMSDADESNYAVSLEDLPF